MAVHRPESGHSSDRVIPGPASYVLPRVRPDQEGDPCGHKSDREHASRLDRVLLVELAAAGDFAEIEEPLLHRREHPNGSVIAAERARTGQTSNDSLRRGSIRVVVGAFRQRIRVVQLPSLRPRFGLRCPTREHIHSLAVALGWAARHGRIIGGELKIVTRELVSEALAGPKSPNSD